MATRRPRAGRLTRPNPVLSNGFAHVGPADARRMTLTGAVGKAALLLAIAVTSAALAWVDAGTADNINVVAVLGAAVGGLILVVVAARRPAAAPGVAPVYAAVEGYVVGSISLLYHSRHDGIVVQAAGLTVAVFAALLVAYATRLIRPSENFKLGVAGATGGVALFYLASVGLGLLGIQMPLVHDNGGWGIAFSLFVVALASANLVIDFDFIEDGAARGAPQYMEWFAALGLLVTLVWLYLELLRLLSKGRSRG